MVFLSFLAGFFIMFLDIMADVFYGLVIMTDLTTVIGVKQRHVCCRTSHKKCFGVCQILCARAIIKISIGSICLPLKEGATAYLCHTDIACKTTGGLVGALSCGI